ncbi:MAG: hypothetical protein HND56_12445 [Pseudomonadota bacterium]|nr:hypothetical protein [Pseudomonadota bacterium]QKK06440.1 MAG: hypothetical protein HND56_12445 [Pseudomonadota bacterium]
MIPKFTLAKLGITFAKAVSKHRKKILHVGDVELLVRDLGQALNDQHHTLINPRNSTIETAYEILPQMAEVRVLTGVVRKHLNIDPKKDQVEAMKEIVEKMEAEGSDAADDIKDNLKWLDEFYSSDEAKELMSMEVTEVETPGGLLDYKGAFKTVKQAASRAFDETMKAHKFMSLAKKFEEMQRREKREAEKAAKTPDQTANDTTPAAQQKSENDNKTTRPAPKKPDNKKQP